MYAVIKTGGKQYKVAKGDVLEVEHIRLKGEETTTEIAPLLVITDEGKTISGAKDLADFKVGIKMVGDSKGDKITVLKYRPKSGYYSKTGHRQHYSLIEITGIGAEKDEKPKKASAKKKEAPAESDTVDGDGS